jgi:hypothetical protein
MQLQRPHLREVAATHATSVVAATTPHSPHRSKLGGRRDLRLWRSRGDLRVSRQVSRQSLEVVGRDLTCDATELALEQRRWH